jgi:hypothetical protein
MSVLRICYLILIVLFVVSAEVVHAQSQRPRRPMVTSLSASIDKDGPHPDKAELKGPTPITCISAISDDANSPKLSCRITAPGFSGTVAVGSTVNATDAGTVTLGCNGAGWVRCRARVN